jgi:hypothetical protein
VALGCFDVPVFGVAPVDEGHAALIIFGGVSAVYVISLVMAGVDSWCPVWSLRYFNFGGNAYVDELAVEVPGEQLNAAVSTISDIVGGELDEGRFLTGSFGCGYRCWGLRRGVRSVGCRRC